MGSKTGGLNVFPKNHTRAFSNRMNREFSVQGYNKMWDSCESVLQQRDKLKLKGKL